MARLAAGMLVAALIRRIDQVGGSATLLARGDASAGTVLVQLAERGEAGDLVERVLNAQGCYCWTPIGPGEADKRAGYLSRRRNIDPDLWIVELDHEGAAQLLDEVTGLL